MAGGHCGGAVVFGIVNGQSCHSPNWRVRFAVVTGENGRANGSSIACNPGLDGFSACRSMLHRSRFAAPPEMVLPESVAAVVLDQKDVANQRDIILFFQIK